MLLQGNTSQVRNVQQDIMKIEGNVELTEQKSRKNRKDDLLRKRRESFWIHLLGSLHPTGLNVDP